MTEMEAFHRLMRRHPSIRAKLHALALQGRLLDYGQAPKDGETLLVICGPDHGGIAGAKQGRCGCGAFLWISPSTQMVVAGRTSPTEIVCPDCASKVFQKADA